MSGLEQLDGSTERAKLLAIRLNIASHFVERGNVIPRRSGFRTLVQLSLLALSNKFDPTLPGKRRRGPGRPAKDAADLRRNVVDAILSGVPPKRAALNALERADEKAISRLVQAGYRARRARTNSS
jgi:hypothetical protein